MLGGVIGWGLDGMGGRPYCPGLVPPFPFFPMSHSSLATPWGAQTCCVHVRVTGSLPDPQSHPQLLLAFAG